MKNFTKFLVGIALSLAVFVLPMMALAQKDYGIGKTVQSTGGLLPTKVAGASTVPQLVGNIVAVGLSLLGIVFFGLFLYSGILWMTALGNGEKVNAAKETLQAAIIGLIIVVGAYAISRFLFDNLVNTTTTSSSSPDSSQSSVANTPPSTCSGSQEAGDTCGAHMTCQGEAGKLQCVSECESLLGGTCGLPSSCKDPKTTIKDKCPGASNNICCYEKL